MNTLQLEAMDRNCELPEVIFATSPHPLAPTCTGVGGDHELLELAAKAAGIAIVPCTCSDTRWPFKHDEAISRKTGHWNPLFDDGDALRLAVKLEMQIWHNTGGTVSGMPPSAGFWDRLREPLDPDPYAATRRAIVRAAAALTKNSEVAP